MYIQVCVYICVCKSLELRFVLCYTEWREEGGFILTLYEAILGYGSWWL